MTLIDHAINSALKKFDPSLSKLFADAIWERIPNASSDAGKSMAVYAAQAGDVTVLAWHQPNHNWRFQKVFW